MVSLAGSVAVGSGAWRGVGDAVELLFDQLDDGGNRVAIDGGIAGIEGGLPLLAALAIGRVDRPGVQQHQAAVLQCLRGHRQIDHFGQGHARGAWVAHVDALQADVEDQPATWVGADLVDQQGRALIGRAALAAPALANLVGRVGGHWGGYGWQGHHHASDLC